MNVNSDVIDFYLVDGMGRKVINGLLYKEGYFIDLSDLPIGLYYIVFITKCGYSLKKVMKE